jgi:hypothetical protein
MDFIRNPQQWLIWQALSFKNLQQIGKNYRKKAAELTTLLHIREWKMAQMEALVVVL